MKVAPVLIAVVFAAGCGSSPGPQLAHDDAAGLISLTHRIAAEGACAQARDIPRLQARATALVNAHRVPPRLQDPLMSGVNALGAESPVCLPTVPAATTTPTPVVVAPKPPGHPHPHPHPHPGHGHHGHHH